MAASVKQGVISKTTWKNKNAKYKLTYRRTYGQTLRGGQLSYSYSKSVNLSYR